MSILLIGAVACIAALLLSAWLMTFARWFPIEGIDGKFLVDYKAMIRGHIDYALMALFNLAFFGVGIDLPVLACWCVAIGGFTNPTIFVIAAFDPDFWNKAHWKIFSLASFLITTLGFGWISLTLLKHAF